MFEYFVSYFRDGAYGNQVVRMPVKLTTVETINGLQEHLGGVTILSFQQINYDRTVKKVTVEKVADES